MQQLSLSAPTGQRPARIALGIAGIVALALVLGWFLLQLEPAAPRKAAPLETPASTMLSTSIRPTRWCR